MTYVSLYVYLIFCFSLYLKSTIIISKYTNLDEDIVSFPKDCNDKDFHNCARVAVEDINQRNKTCILKNQQDGFITEVISMQKKNNEEVFQNTQNGISMFFNNTRH